MDENERQALWDPGAEYALQVCSDFRSRPSGKGNLLRRLMALILRAALAGTVAGCVCFGVSTFLTGAAGNSAESTGDSAPVVTTVKTAVSELSEGTLEQIRVVSIGSSDDLAVGQQVVAIGNALGYGQSVTTGIVSAVDRVLSGDTSAYIQTDAAINPGNSGGALLNMDGELVGINTAKISTTAVEGMGYAIPISAVLELITSMIC